MAKILCVSNQKGGVGKTTTTNALAMGLRRLGRRVLCVDFDPQGDLPLACGPITGWRCKTPSTTP